MDEYLPVRRIELILGMPEKTLTLFLIGERGLPRKWHKKLKIYLGIYEPPTEQPVNKVIKKEHPKMKTLKDLPKIDKIKKSRVSDL